MKNVCLDFTWHWSLYKELEPDDAVRVEHFHMELEPENGVSQNMGTWDKMAQRRELMREMKISLNSVCGEVPHTLTLFTSPTGPSLSEFKKQKEGRCSSFTDDSSTSHLTETAYLGMTCL